MSRDEDFRVRPGKVGARQPVRSKPFVTQVLIAANRAGGMAGRNGGGGFGRGRAASIRATHRLGARARRVTIKARFVRHGRVKAPLAPHLVYLRRDGVTREGEPGRLFDRASEEADGRAFAERCHDDRHHFRFIVAPEDAADLVDLRRFTRDLMADAERDLSTSLDWVAVDHWNTPHPHVHVLVRGIADDGSDLVISRDYLSQGLRARASDRATLELGPRTELELRRNLEREVEADRWTPLDRTLVREAGPGGVVDLRPPLMGDRDPLRPVKLERMRKLEGLTLAEPLGPARWRLREDLEPTLRALQERGDVIKRLHRAMRDQGVERAASDLVLEGRPSPNRPLIGRLAARGLDDELSGSAYAVIDGTDGRAHHVRLPSLEAAGDGPIGGVVEARWTQGQTPRLVLATRCDLNLAQQIEADGATWLDRQLVGRTPVHIAERGFGAEVRRALEERTERLIDRGWAERASQGLSPASVRFKPGLLDGLRRQELEQTARRLAERTGLEHHPVQEGDSVAGTLRRRLTLASGRFAMIDDGLGFQLVPWRDDLGRQIGREISGVALPGGGVEWSFDRKRGLGL